MRQVIIQTPRGRGREALDTAKTCGAANAAAWPAEDGGTRLDIVQAWLPNDRVEDLMAALQDMPELRITLFPHGDLPLRPPASEALRQAMNVEPLSPTEIFLSGLQGVGSWRAYLAYALATGFVVWIGLFTNTIYLLVAAMLIAPFAGPSMNAALATARGDASLLGSSIVRSAAGLAVTVAVSAALSLAFRLETPTRLMTDVSIVSAMTLVLSLVAGGAGAVSLVQSERNSLVSGAAVGMLVAASLAPPAGIIGIFAAMGEWGVAKNGLYLLLNQLIGLNLAGAIVFRAYGLKPGGARYERGKAWLAWAALVATGVALAGLAAWQFRALPDLQRSDVEQRAEAEVERAVRESGLATLAEQRVRFTGRRVQGRPALLVEAFVVAREDAPPGDEAAGRLTALIRERLEARRWGIDPLVRVTVLEAARPGAALSGRGAAPALPPIRPRGTDPGRIATAAG